MHDVIAHSLAVMITLTDAAAAVSATGTARDTVIQASEVGRQALAEMQRMLSVFRGADPPDLTPQPGVERLTGLINLVRSAGLIVELAMSGDPAELSPTIQLSLYRIVQESLTNVLKHGSNVRRVVVSIDYRDRDRIRLHIMDDGDPAAGGATAGVGHGLVGMRERVALFGGQFQAGSIGTGGWEVIADLILAHPANLA